MNDELSECCWRQREYVSVVLPCDGEWIACKWCGYLVRREFEPPPVENVPYLI